MALLFFDGFDHSGTSGTATSTHAMKYAAWFGANGQMVGSPVRTGTGAIQITFVGTAIITKTLPVTGNTAIVGVAVRFQGTPSAVDDAIRVCEGATVHVTLSLNSSRQLVVRRG